MKRLDRYILALFSRHLLLTFVVSMIVLLLNFVWLYIDDFVGKGLQVGIIVELFTSLIVRLIPMALTLAVLVASVMSFGHLSEHKELTAMRASGIPITRLYIPLIFFLLLLSLASFSLSDRLIPVTNLKFRALLADIQDKQPDVFIPQAEFYNGIEDISILVGKKDKKGDMLYDILIYDHRDAKNEDRMIVAQSGYMVVDRESAKLAFTLLDGSTYTELRQSGNNQTGKKFRRDYFESQVILVDLPGFNLERRNGQMYASLYTMLNNKQLRDTSLALVDERKWEAQKFANQLIKDFMEGPTRKRMVSEPGDFNQIIIAARRNQQLIQGFSEQQYERMKWNNRFVIERQYRMALALMCLVFFFIGAPLGAIFKSGGLGTPVVISTICYIIYYILNLFGTKSARADEIPVFAGIWGPVLVLLIAGFLIIINSKVDFRLGAPTRWKIPFTDKA